MSRRSKTSDSTLTTVVSRLIEAYRPERVYLFGSAARGDAGPDSDYDLLLVMPDNSPDELLNAGRAHEVLWGIKAATDVLIWPHSKFESRLHLRASLPSVVTREGKLLYAA